MLHIRKISSFIHTHSGWFVAAAIVVAVATFFIWLNMLAAQTNMENRALKEKTSLVVTGTVLNTAPLPNGGDIRYGQRLEVQPDGKIETLVVDCTDEALCPFLSVKAHVSFVTFQQRDALMGSATRAHTEHWRRA